MVGFIVMTVSVSSWAIPIGNRVRWIRYYVSSRRMPSGATGR